MLKRVTIAALPALLLAAPALAGSTASGSSTSSITRSGSGVVITTSTTGNGTSHGTASAGGITGSVTTTGTGNGGFTAGQTPPPFPTFPLWWPHFAILGGF
ncbi:MAG: hypothetical protein JO290_10350 [Sphingomonadaceae bacterium]|nr:hypothetical protein [Sphingomonadaceae bacterium]